MLTKVLLFAPGLENCWKCAKLCTMMRFSCAVMGLVPACSIKYSTRFLYSASPPCDAVWCSAKLDSSTKLASHS